MNEKMHHVRQKGIADTLANSVLNIMLLQNSHQQWPRQLKKTQAMSLNKGMLYTGLLSHKCNYIVASSSHETFA